MSKDDDLYVDVISFIGRFSIDDWGYRNEVIEAFTQGCCYWFAFILHTRFACENPAIMIDYIVGHFGCKIGEKVYDITGDVTETYRWETWTECSDEALIRRITEDCIMF